MFLHYLGKHKPKIASCYCHLNAECYFVNRHRKYIHIITRSQLNRPLFARKSAICTKQDQRRYILSSCVCLVSVCVCLCVCVSVCCWPKFWRLTATYWRNHSKRTGKYQMANNSVNHWLLAYVFNKFGESDKQRQRSVYMCCGNILRLLTFRQNWRQNYSGTFYFRTRCRRHRHLRPYFAFFTFTFICQEWYAMCYNKTVIGRTSQAKSSYICCSKICSQTMNVQFLHRLMRIVDVWEAKMDD